MQLDDQALGCMALTSVFLGAVDLPRKCRDLKWHRICRMSIATRLSMDQAGNLPVGECSEHTDKKGSHHAKASRSHSFQARGHDRHGHAYRRINADDNPWTGLCREPDGPGDSG
jgi:hypothetical protein